MNKNNNTAHSCTYIGTGQGCTHDAQAGSSYCAEHYAIVYKVGSGKVRKKDNRTVNRVRMVEQLFQEAIDQLLAEGFDVYGDLELVPQGAVEEFDDR